MLRRLSLILIAVSNVLCSSFLLATEDIYIPQSLEPWVDWVLEEHPYISCPVRATDGVRLDCIWVRETNISVIRGSTFGATFELTVHAFAESWLQLPHSESFKPQNFTLNGREVALGGGNNAPEVLVPEGVHTLKGELMWTEESEPRFLDIPLSGIVRLAINGQPVEHPSLQAGGNRLWLSNEISDTPTIASAPNSEVVRVFRHFTDSIPQTLTTYVQVTVTGSPRILNFGTVINEDYQITNLRSSWPAILSRDGNLVVQVVPGANVVQIDARATQQMELFRYKKASPLWPSVEYWGIQPRHELRIIRMEGAVRTDLSQINAPRQMRQLNGFVLTENDELRIIEEQRGNVQPYPSSFDISRDIWLNFRGDSFTIADSIEADIETSQRVSSSIPLGEVRVNGISRLITYDSSNEQSPSIYLKPGYAQVSAISKIPKSVSLTPNTWNVEAEELSARLHLPPGWMLLWTHGIDQVDSSWVAKWGIWDVFVILLLLCLVWGLGGWKWTTIVFGAALISYQMDQAPTLGWVVLAGMCYVLKAIKHETLSRIAHMSFWVVFTVVSIACIFYATNSMSNALHPQLASQSSTFKEQITTVLEARYSAEDIRWLGAESFADYFRKIPNQSPSFIQDSSAAQTSEIEEHTESVMVTGSRMPKVLDSDVRGMSTTVARGTGLLDSAERRRRLDFDPTLPIAIQTGPGKPNWRWQSVSLAWHGPVEQGRDMVFVLLAPWLTRLLYGISALAVLLVPTYFIYLRVPNVVNCIKKVLSSTTSVAALALVAVLLSPQDSQADIPDADLLQELENRLLALPDCLSDCAYLEQAQVSLKDEELTITMQVHTQDRVALPLPTENGTWNLVDLRLGELQLPLLREHSRLYTVLDEGVHEITMVASIHGLDQFDIAFDLIPGHLEIHAPNWKIEGLIRGQVGDRKLTFARASTVETNNSQPTITNFFPLEIEPYVSVQRQIVLSYEPTVVTRVSRVAPHTGEITVRIPLLPDEVVITAGLSVEDGHMVVNLKPAAQTVLWDSKLDVDNTIILSAPSVAERSERWSISGSDFWNYHYDGIVPIDVDDQQTTFIPRSNEILHIDVQQGEPVPGDSVTIDHVFASHTVEPKVTNSYLEMTILASQPADIELTLPDDAKVESMEIAGDFQSLPANNTSIVFLPLRAGSHQYSLTWKSETGTSILYRPPTVSISRGAVNVSAQIRFAEKRWILWLAGPALGSTVLYWSILIGVLVAAVAFSKIPGIAISTKDAVILSIGATLVHLIMLVFVGVWFLALWLKSQTSEEIARPWLYRVGQLLLTGITLLALYVIINTIVAALTNDPNMYLYGLESTNQFFAWFTDEISDSVPSPWVWSLPLWIYFALILLWTMWLVFMITEWIRVWWQTLKAPALWLPIDYKGSLSKLPIFSGKHRSATETESRSD